MLAVSGLLFFLNRWPGRVNTCLGSAATWQPAPSLTWVFKAVPDWSFCLRYCPSEAPPAPPNSPQRTRYWWLTPSPAPPGYACPQGMAVPSRIWVPLPPSLPPPRVVVRTTSQYAQASPCPPTHCRNWLTCPLPPHPSELRASPWDPPQHLTCILALPTPLWSCRFHFLLH